MPSGHLPASGDQVDLIYTSDQFTYSTKIVCVPDLDPGSCATGTGYCTLTVHISLTNLGDVDYNHRWEVIQELSNNSPETRVGTFSMSTDQTQAFTQNLFIMNNFFVEFPRSPRAHGLGAQTPAFAANLAL